MRKQIIFIVFAVVFGMTVKAQTSDFRLSFNELPFEEGTLYVSIACDDKEINRKAVEVSDDIVTLPLNIGEYIGKEISVNAFQDLNENRELDFDSYGRPVEPCLRTKIMLEEGRGEYELRLIQY